MCFCMLPLMSSSRIRSNGSSPCTERNQGLRLAFIGDYKIVLGQALDQIFVLGYQYIHANIGNARFENRDIRALRAKRR